MCLHGTVPFGCTMLSRMCERDNERVFSKETNILPGGLVVAGKREKKTYSR